MYTIHYFLFFSSIIFGKLSISDEGFDCRGKDSISTLPWIFQKLVEHSEILPKLSYSEFISIVLIGLYFDVVDEGTIVVVTLSTNFALQ